MCMQCAAEGATYVGGAVGALQVLKVRARGRRRPSSPASVATPPPDATSDPQPADR
jgi:hypothetical protein